MDFNWMWLLRLLWAVFQAVMRFLEGGNTVTFAKADGTRVAVSKKPGHSVEVTVADKSGTQTFGGTKIA